MDYQFTLRRFFVLVFLFVICPLVAWIAYARRTNAPSNMYEGTDVNAPYQENSISIPEDKLDMTTPFYQNAASEKLEKDLGRPTEATEAGYFSGDEKAEGKEHEKSNEKPVNEKDSTKKEMK